MRQTIRVLDDALIDQIAAGEVVDRPASIVKELLDNALDAGASQVKVQFEAGGVEAIVVSDDGSGIPAAELPLAVRRHATSKIRSTDDLHALETRGFRGEALPSIASVSRFAITSRPPDAIAAGRLRIDGGSDPVLRETGAAPGTTVEVRDLFYNVPARRKFLKAGPTETAHINDVCLRMALAHPKIRLTVLRGTKRLREYLPEESAEARVRSALAGVEVRPLHGKRKGVEVEAYLSAPEKARSGAQKLYLYVNRRPVKDRALSRAVAFAYGSVLPPGRYPSGVVFVTVPPDEVDVNVHPQKSEVRFSRGREVLDTVTRLLAAALGTTAWDGPATRKASYWEQRLGPDPKGTSGTATPANGSSDRPATDAWGLSEGLFAEGGAAEGTPSYAPRRDTPALIAPRSIFGELRVLGQVRRMILVCEGPDAIYFIDQHAADERLRYHKLKAEYESKSVPVQRLLFPERVDVAAAELALIEEHGDTIRSLGIDCSPLGPDTVAVRAVPTLVKRAPPARLLRDVLDELSHSGDRSFGDAIDTALATMACHGAIRAGDSLSNAEASALLRALDEVPQFAGHCPHGRPIVSTAPLDEIERRLGR
ncbi:MAG: DNA mismatch repair endonuclease MutL [Myxococcota bacterium]